MQKFGSCRSEALLIGLNSGKLLTKETSSLCESLEKLLIHSVSTSTWRKHCSAWKLYTVFCDIFGLNAKSEIKIEEIRAFATWAISSRKLQPSTVESYISSLNTAQCLAGRDPTNFSNDRCLKLILKGGENASLLHGKESKLRLAMNKNLLKILGHRICIENWDEIFKQSVWTACLVSFYTSCRMGEIVAKNSCVYDSKTTLLWEDVIFAENNEISILIPFTKTSGLKGSIIDIFPVNDRKTCPSAALSKLKNLNLKTKIFSSKKPVFSLTNGKFLTVETLNSILAKLLADFTDENSRISCHSFRAAIPSAISSQPNKSTVAELKEWGKWHSDSFKRYTKREKEKRRVLFYKSIEFL